MDFVGLLLAKVLEVQGLRLDTAPTQQQLYNNITANNMIP